MNIFPTLIGEKLILDNNMKLELYDLSLPNIQTLAIGGGGCGDSGDRYYCDPPPPPLLDVPPPASAFV